jgi:hypothetical protein
VRSDARSDAANTAYARCGDSAVLIDGREGFSPEDHRCPPEPEFVVETITDAARVQERMAAFDRSLRDSGNAGRVRSCRMIVDVTKGLANSNHSYGAICRIESAGASHEYFLCNDEMVGHFALATRMVESREALADFVKWNCVGG